MLPIPEKRKKGTAFLIYVTHTYTDTHTDLTAQSSVPISLLDPKALTLKQYLISQLPIPDVDNFSGTSTVNQVVKF